jgi:hypothetical protein
MTETVSLPFSILYAIFVLLIILTVYSMTTSLILLYFQRKRSSDVTSKPIETKKVTSSALVSDIRHSYGVSDVLSVNRDRFEELKKKKLSSEFTRRGTLWSKHASWNLPSAPRMKPSPYHAEGLEHIFALLKKYDVDPTRGSFTSSIAFLYVSFKFIFS